MEQFLKCKVWDLPGEYKDKTLEELFALLCGNIEAGGVEEAQEEAPKRVRKKRADVAEEVEVES
ncbi:hypothetical protein EBZ38_03830 [bacterium]|nr:hypothetical protein [bacterium]NDD83397.1 hypothetical protein [bacterium]